MGAEPDKRRFFSQAVEDNMDALYGVALRLTRNGADAEDLVAEAVTRAWSAIDGLADRSRFRPWIFRILRNSFISAGRKRAIRPTELHYEQVFTDEGEGELSSLLIDQPEEFLHWWANPERAVASELLGRQIAAAIESLPEAFRTTVLLVNVDGLGYDEAAEVLGVPPGTVRSRMKRGRTLLQKALWQHASEAGLAAPDAPSETQP
jgi:RNA polymerase sigma-70 factor (ECF subfamily)